MLALLRPGSWDFPLFLHVLGAILLVGAVAATAIAAGRSQRSLVLRRVAFGTLAVLALPAWVLMRFAGQWSDSKEPVEGAWLDMGYIVGDAGLVVLLVTTGIGWWSARRLERRWPALGVTVLATAYLAALLVTMWAMTTKPD